MYRLEYYNGSEWVLVQEWYNEILAWASLGGDNYNYRIVDKDGNVVKENTTWN